MDAKDLLRHQLDDAGYQLTQVLTGFPPAALEVPGNGSNMSPREQIDHLTESYLAFMKELEGGKHEWGSYESAGDSLDALLAKWKEMRDQAVTRALEAEAYYPAHAYMVGHDYYHIGQLCTARIASDPEWHPYSIYRWG